LLIGTHYLYESSDGGKTFTVIGGFKPGTNTPALKVGEVNSIVYGGRANGVDAPDVAYVGTFDRATKVAKLLLRLARRRRG
jgi:hypothetical protein